MRRETYLAWLPCEEKEMYGLYDGCIDPQASCSKVPPYLKGLLEKAETKSGSEKWVIDAGIWYFGAAAVERIKSELGKE